MKEQPSNEELVEMRADSEKLLHNGLVIIRDVLRLGKRRRGELDDNVLAHVYLLADALHNMPEAVAGSANCYTPNKRDIDNARKHHRLLRAWLHDRGDLPPALDGYGPAPVQTPGPEQERLSGAITLPSNDI